MIHSELTRAEVRKKMLKNLGKFYLVGFCMYSILLFVVYLISPGDIIFVHFLGFGFLFITVVPILGTLVIGNIFSLFAKLLGAKSDIKFKGHWERHDADRHVSKSPRNKEQLRQIIEYKGLRSFRK